MPSTDQPKEALRELPRPLPEHSNSKEIRKQGHPYNNNVECNLSEENMVLYVKQYGLQKTCINLSRKLVEENLKEVLLLGNTLGVAHGKHPKEIDWTGKNWGMTKGRPTIDAFTPIDLKQIKRAKLNSELRYLICTKNPYSWYISHLQHRQFPLEPLDLLDLRSEIRLWSAIHKHWAKEVIHKEKAWVCREEDILENPLQWVNEIAEWLDVPKVEKLGAFGQKLIKARNTDTYSYYKEKKYLNYYSPRALEIFQVQLDEALMELLGYDIVDPEKK